MQKVVLKILTSILIVLSTEQSCAQKNDNQSLLWRISGNGLSAPSYLFGTMHVKNNKAFNFKDSLYYYIENTSGFAMEVHPDSAGQILKAVAEGRIDFDTDNWDYDKDFDEKEFEKIVQKIEKEKKPVAKSAKEKITYLMEKLLDSKKENENGMETFMDAYLYGLALQNQKNIFGLEQVEDQIKAFQNLMKGIRINTIAALADKGKLQSTPLFYDYYYKENIDSIYHFYTSLFSDSTLKGFLFDRNIGMVQKMDSLVKLQTMFFAIGAGHLPGKEGVISLLRKNGYSVDPVFSAKKIFAGNYLKKTIATNWNTYYNEAMGFECQMPGKITIQQGTKGKEVCYSYNLPMGTVYMVVSGKLTSAERRLKTDSLFMNHCGVILESMNGHMDSRKPIEIKGLKGFEMIANSKSNGYSRIVEIFDERNFYMLTISAEKKDNLNNDNTEQYFNSFKSKPIKPVSWKVLDSKSEGFLIDFPGVTKNQPVRTEEGSNISMNSYLSFEGNSGISYTLYFSRAEDGTQFPKGDLFFSTYIQNLKESAGDFSIEQRDTVLFGYPAKVLISSSTTEQILEGFMLLRDNNSYLYFAEYDKGEKKEEDLRRFFNSFKLQAFPETEWNEVGSPDGLFRAWVPGPINKEVADTNNYFDKQQTMYYSTDKYSAAYCSVDVSPVSKYYWADNADSVYEYFKQKNYFGYNDSILSYSITQNGGIKSREVIVYNKSTREKNRHRLILSGRNVYTISKVVSPFFANEKNDNRFFESFKLGKEESSDDIFSQQPDMLFNDLLSKDSTVFKEAFDALDDVSFRQKHFQLILQKSLLEYSIYDDMYQTVNEKLIYLAKRMSKESENNREQLVSFITDHYSLPGKKNANNRFQLLGLLAEMKTASSYQLLSNLINDNPPAGNGAYHLFGFLTDSLELTKSLYPGLLKFASDSSIGLSILSVAKTLIDSSYLSINDIIVIQPEIIKTTQKYLKSLTKMAEDDYDYDYEILDLIALLEQLKNKQANEAIAGFSKVKLLPVKYKAVISLFKNNWPVNIIDLKKLAAHNEYRASLYEELFKIKKTALFPGEFANQLSMGKSYIYKRMVEWDEVEDQIDLIYIKKIQKEYKGSPKTFYLYRVNMGETEEDHAGEPEMPYTQTYLGIAGPFDLNAKKIQLAENENISGVYYDTKFDGLRLNEFFEKYVADYIKNNQ